MARHTRRFAKPLAQPKRCQEDGHKFASKLERERYRQLKVLLADGKIEGLELQPKYWIVIDGRPLKIKSAGYPNGRRISHILDFRYVRVSDGAEVIEDVKGSDTPIGALKRALVEHIHGISVRVL